MANLKRLYSKLIETKIGADENEQTATRVSLTQEWQDLQKKVDWMHAPLMAHYVNGLVSGKNLDEGGHWAIYASEKYLLSKQKQKKSGLSMVSLACGSGYIEESLLTTFHWPISSFVGLEYDAELRKNATQRFSEIRTCKSKFLFFDFNQDWGIKEQFDVIFVCASLHHAHDLERTLENVNRLMKPDGLFIGIDFFGPTRFQIEYDVLPIVQELFSYLPDELRRNLGSAEMRVDGTYEAPTIEAVRSADISEAVRSSDLRTLLFANFPVIEIKPMGGTILRWLLNNRAGNFDWSNPNHMCIIRLLQFIERELIHSNRMKSDDLFFVLGKSSRLPA